MSYAFPLDLKQLVAERMAAGNYQSEDDLLRQALVALAESDHDLSAVRDAIDNWRAGDQGTPLAEAFVAIRQRHGVPKA